jgi:hypothetical protein
MPQDYVNSDEEDDKFDIPNIIEGSVDIRGIS